MNQGVTDPEAIPPAALVRFVNAVVDTGTVDLRFVDQVENLPTFQGVAFRATSGGYQRVIPGARVARVFPNSNDPLFASLRLVDTTITLEVNKRYTLVYAGAARGNQDRLAVIEDPAELPAPAAGSIGVKTLHAVRGTANVDVYVGNAENDPIVTPVARTNNVAYLAASPYVTVPARTGTGLYEFSVAPAGTTPASFSATPNQPGAASTIPTVGPQPGVRIAGSVLTALLLAGAVAGSPAAAGSSTNPGLLQPTVLLLVDKTLDP